MMRDSALIFGKNREDRNRGKQTGKIRWQAEIGRSMQSTRIHRKEDRAPFSGDVIDGKNKNQSEELSLHVSQQTSASTIQKNQPANVEGNGKKNPSLERTE